MSKFRIFFVFLLIALFSNIVHAKNHKIGILVYDDVLGSDITAPLEVFGAASKKEWFNNYTVQLISVNSQASITTAEGLRIVVDNNIENTINTQFDVLIVPSRYSMGELLDNQQLINYIRQQGKNVKWLASNCSGSELLAKTGLLDGIKATTWAGGEDSLQKAFPKVKVQHDQNVVIDSNVITSNGSVVSYQAALLLLSKLSSAKQAKEIEEYIQLPRLSGKSLLAG